MNDGIRYQVTTHWGTFSLDEGSYRDYLAGKLWISWVPGKSSQNTAHPPIDDNQVPANVTQRALELRDNASKERPISVLESLEAMPNYAAAYMKRLEKESIDDMMLTTRARNGLLRAGVDTLGKLNALYERENGIMNVRNLGVKSAREISTCFFSVCYDRLTKGERAIVWQRIIDAHSI